MDIVIMHIVISIMILIVKLQNQPNTKFGQLGLVLWRGWQQEQFLQSTNTVCQSNGST